MSGTVDALLDNLYDPAYPMGSNANIRKCNQFR